MTTALHYNGSIEIELKPVDPVEKAILAEALRAAELGRKITLAAVGDGYKIVVEKA
jgi:hypothetical protein